MTWHTRHIFCSRCGSPTAIREAGHVRLCLNPDCAAPCFPRTDPAVIMLIHDGGDRIVLGRQSRWPPGQHSILAGRSEEHTSELQSLMRISYAVFCLKKKRRTQNTTTTKIT